MYVCKHTFPPDLSEKMPLCSVLILQEWWNGITLASPQQAINQSVEMIVLLYLALVWPHFEYCVWF